MPACSAPHRRAESAWLALVAFGCYHAFMFGWWKKKPVPKLIGAPDAVYMRREVADTALAQAVKESERPVIITSFFEDSLTRAEGVLRKEGLLPRSLATGNWPSYSTLEGAPWLLGANLITAPYGFDNWITRSNREFSFLFVELHPLVNTERAVLDVLERVSATCPQRVLFFVGLDEPLMFWLGGNRIIDLMQTLGLAPEEKIGHPMVDKALVKARMKLQQRVTQVMPAKSDAEWFELNIRGR